MITNLALLAKNASLMQNIPVSNACVSKNSNLVKIIFGILLQLGMKPLQGKG